jgi:acyl transferase domain-containing protein/acyl carrier protein/NAD(P)-dependent dehydrogenase (short-subunit alcohol dehydrogenase family)
MKQSEYKAVAIVGVGAVLPDAQNARAFWKNLIEGRYSITDVRKGRWNADLYYNPDPKTPDKSYTKIGGWVHEFDWDPLKWKLPIPPKVSMAMDFAQKWAIIAAREALADYGYPDKKSLDNERTAVILGNALGGDLHLQTSARIMFPEFAEELLKAPSFSELPPNVRKTIIREFQKGVGSRWLEITEDTMPGELSNIIAGRIAALYNFRGPNYSVDAACASAMAAITSAIEGLVENDFDAVITGGIDANMSASTYIKFCKIGALSGTGTRPYDNGADGFVMGEGAAIFILKRLEDAERDGDRIYAVIRGLGGSSDGKGKGITAPNPIGQKLAVARAWENAGLSPATAAMLEGHGTSTVVGDAAELQSLEEVFRQFGLKSASIALGSVKSNIGHLKGAAGAAGMLKTALSLHEKMIPPSLNFKNPNANIDFNKSPFFVNTELRPWEVNGPGVRRAGVSAFGFGGTNFHAVLEEFIPGMIDHSKKKTVAVEDFPREKAAPATAKTPLRGALVVGAASESAVAERLMQVQKEAESGVAPPPAPPAERDLHAPVRIAIDYSDADDLAKKCQKALQALNDNKPRRWKVLRSQGVHLGKGEPPKVAFLYTGQGSQYVNMLKELREKEAVVAQTFREADEVMTPLLQGKPLTEYIFVNGEDEKEVARAEDALRQTKITQPAVLSTDVALTRLLSAYGIAPDMVMGHSLGEYGALVASRAMPLGDALRAVSARGSEMTRVSMEDNGLMAACFGPLEEIEKIISQIEGYVVIANINSYGQAVIGGATDAVKKATKAVQEAGYVATQLPVSHAFHTKIVAPASEPLARVLGKMDLQLPQIPLIANVTGEPYPMGPDVKPQMLDLLAQQIAAPVQFIKGLNTLYEMGARLFVEVGPKRALHGFVEDVLGKYDDVIALSTNYPKNGDIGSFNQALCGFYAAGLGAGVPDVKEEPAPVVKASSQAAEAAYASVSQPAAPQVPLQPSGYAAGGSASQFFKAGNDRYRELGHLFAEFLERGMKIYSGGKGTHWGGVAATHVCITGAALGLPGTKKVFDDGNIERILRGEQFIDVIPMKLRQAMVDKSITRVVKTADGSGSFETINKPSEVIKLAARAQEFDLAEEFGYFKDRMPALDVVTALAIGSGIDAMRDAGIPLVMKYKTTTKGTKLPDRWMLPDEMRDDTGIIFASAFPGLDSYANEMRRYYQHRIRLERLSELENLRARLVQTQQTANGILLEMDRKIEALKAEIEKEPYHFDRRFLLRILSMGHSQFADYIGARGPNTQINSACASTSAALSIANDWIQTGRCSRVIIISADDITTDDSLEWFAAGFLASGAAATDEAVENAAIPFDRRRHGLIIGMGGAALVVESPESARERGIQPICEVLSTVTANSAFHATRLDVDHICNVMDNLICQAEAQWGINRFEIAPQTVFVSHETYTPARGGSASAEIYALRHVFKQHANDVVIANTKGFTGHPMAVGIEEVVAVKILETGIVPPVANYKEVDPELGQLNLSKGGYYPVQYALRLGAGFGSQISMALMRWVPTTDGKRRPPSALGYEYRIVDQTAWKNWLKRISGNENVELTIDRRNLKVVDNGLAAQSVPATAKEVPTSTPAPAVPDPAVPAPPATPATAPVEQPVQKQVLQIISEKTGYPIDMLELELDLEADLGIDTVKQAEMFAAIREAYDIPRDDNLKLRDFPTLAHAIQFVYDHRPDLKKPLKSTQTGVQPAVKDEAQPTSTIAEPEPTIKTGDPVKEKVLQLIAEKTGYPVDMLDPELDLEADLGIDTVKQAEMFAAIREAYDIPRDDNLQLRDFPTLAHTIQFVYDHRPELKEPAAGRGEARLTPAVAETAYSTEADDPIKEKVLDLIAEKTGYPKDMLDPELDLEADLGIDTVKQAEMFAAIREVYDIPREDNLQLRDFPTLAHTIQFVYDRRPDLKKPATDALSTEASASMPTVGIKSSKDLTAPEGDDSVKEKVLDLIAEKTGYPKDMLDPELDLEADLGIDTVKQAEMFAAIREAYDIPREDNLQLRDFPTLAHTIQFVYDRRPDLKPSSSAPVSTPTATVIPAATTDTATIPTGDMNALAQIPRRVPVPFLRPSLDLCKTTAVNLDAKSRVVVMPDRGGVSAALVKRLGKMGVAVLIIDDTPSAEELTAHIENWLKEGSIQGVYWLPALDNEGDIADMKHKEWREAAHLRIKLLYTAMRTLYNHIDKARTFLVSATRLGGRHGYDETGALAPLGGAVSGFTKAYKREKPEALVKVVDFEDSRKTVAFADLLIEETLRDPGIVEVGYQNNRRYTIGLAEKPAADGNPGMELNKDSVFLITGAAGSIVSAITADLAQASGGTFYLLDLAPKPDPTDPDLQRFASDKENLKRDIFQRLKDSGQRATPALVEKEIAALERKHSALSAIQAVEKAGGTAHYYSVNLLDEKAISKVMKEISKKSGRIDVLLHAGGLEISRLLPDKEAKEFDLVWDVKSEGWFNILSNLGDVPLGAAVVFSSIAGRFGNGGQTDYSSANDFLCKSVSNFRITRPQTRGIAIDWTAWGGIGMAARGSIPAIMKAAGIDMLPPEAGIPFIRRELTAGGTRGEVVAAQGLGIMVQEFDETGGLDTGAESGLSKLLRSRGIMIENVRGVGLYSGLTLETHLDPKQQPFLYDHQIEGTPVLPGVMGIEAMTEAAQLLFPERHVSAIEDVNFMAPFKFYRSEPRTVTVQVNFTTDGKNIVAECRLLGSRTLHGQSEAQVTTHFTARVRLTETPPKSKKIKAPAAADGKKLEAGDIYKLYFHGPAYQVLDSSRADKTEIIGLLAANLPLNHQPDDLPTLVSPRLIELCFQTAGIWEMGSTGRMGLPFHIDRLSILRTSDKPDGPNGSLQAIVTPDSDGSFDAKVVDEKGNVYLMLQGYRTAELPGAIDAELLKPLKTALGQ